MPTLAELRALRAQSGPAPLPRHEMTVTRIEGQHLLDESERLSNELADLLMQSARVDEDGKRTGEPRKAGETGNSARIEEIKAAQKAMLPRLAEFQATIGLRGFTGGDWQRYKDEHPPREDNVSDLRYTAGLCNSADLFAALGKFVATWDGDDVQPGDWDEWLGESITYADRRDMVIAVVEMHEKGLSRVPKSSSGSSTTEPSATD